MKTKIYIIALLGLIVQTILYGQTKINTATETITPFNSSFWNTYADKLKLSVPDRKEFISSHQKLNSATTNQSEQKPYVPQNPTNVNAGPCVNIDFESGNLNGWTPTCGFHPIFNPLGCCPNPGGQQTLMTGAGNDPAGGFPVVATGGNFSLRIGNNITGGQADRVEQTFMVNAANANFTYRYAVVFQDPGHTVAQQPSFQIVMLDSLANQIPCTFYNVSAGGNIPGFFNSPTFNGVVYKPWTNVIVDLTNYIGQNVTIRFTTFDCALGGHYGYAYIDGSCMAFVKGSADTICAGATKTFCAPSGFGSYTWNGPGLLNNSTTCVNVSAVGVYSCQTTLMTGCTGPEFTYTLSNYPNPTVSFNSLSPNACAPQYSFMNTSSISNGFITNYSWNFGTTPTVSAQNPVYTFPGPGNYSVSLTAVSNHSCVNTSTQSIAIYPYPVANFTAPATCQNANVNFTNSSTIATGNISSYTWNFGNGNNSNLTNPSYNYTTSGTFPVTLTAVSNQNCSSTFASNVVIHPVPVVTFTNNDACLGAPTFFTNGSTISSGNITNILWNFDNVGNPTSTLANPNYIYPAVGNYVASLQAISNFNCINNYTSTVVVHAVPTTSFVAQNQCFGTASTFTNLSSIAPGNTIASYIWNFGNQQSSSQTNPQINYSIPNNYIVQLTATSNFNCATTHTALVSIYNLPNVNFNTNNACLNQATQFNNTTIISGGNITKWRWDFQNDGIWDDTISVNPSIVYPNYGNYNTKLQAVSNYQCAASKINQVIVHANPVANFSTKSTCLGDVTKFTNLSTSADGPIISNQWDFNGDNVVDNLFHSPQFTYTASGSYLVKLEVQTVHGCINVQSKSAYVNPKPNPAFVAPNKEGCTGLCVSFTNSSTISNGSISTYQWQFGDGSLPDYSTNPTHCYKSGNYAVTLKVVSDSGCIGTLIMPDYVIVHPKPFADFKIEPEELDENDPSATISTNAGGAYATSYYINDGSSFGVENFNYTFKNLDKVTPVIFQVVTNKYGCKDTTSRIIKLKPSWIIYVPNTFTPNGDGLNDGFTAKGYNINKFTLQIYDRWGHLLFETNDIENKWDGRTRNSDEPIKQDIYVWKINVVDIFNKNHDLTGHVTLLKSEE
ncbi:MAG: PKD domain-containing protein [Bacteroidota bacterium]|nr:PKD domain-containing protein [Bacteroidota bacterium]MDP3145887.1 PKD domain-containing protein [Bacteroidota bacterium]